jgi:hypothetical protein
VLEKLGFRATGAIAPRFSLARGEAAPCRLMTLDLAEGSGGEDGGEAEAGTGTGSAGDDGRLRPPSPRVSARSGHRRARAPAPVQSPAAVPLRT